MNKIANKARQSWAFIVEIRAPLTVLVLYIAIVLFARHLCALQGIDLK